MTAHRYNQKVGEHNNDGSPVRNSKSNKVQIARVEKNGTVTKFLGRSRQTKNDIRAEPGTTRKVKEQRMRLPVLCAVLSPISKAKTQQ